MSKYKIEPVFDSRKRRIPHLVMRGDRYYVRCMINGRQYLQACPHDTLSQARVWVQQFVKARRAGDVAEERQPARSVNCITDVIELYVSLAAAHGRPRAKTVQANVAALQRIIAAGRGVTRLSDLSPQLLDSYRDAMYRQLGRSDSTRRTIASAIRKARSIFARQFRVQYEQAGVDVTVARQWMEYQCVYAAPVEYVMPDPELYEPMLAAARRLPDTQPDLWPAWLLCYDLALRASEAAAARWSWIEMDHNAAGEPRARMIIRPRPEEGFKCKGRSGWVLIPPAVLAELDKLQLQAEHDYILPQATPTGRYELIVRDLAAWMRTQGWQRQECAHELRKLKACFWRAQYGLEQAFEWLRHTDYAVTLRHYAGIPLRPEPYQLELD